MLMPSTGAVPSRTSSAARRIVPSPPSTIAELDVVHGDVVAERGDLPRARPTTVASSSRSSAREHRPRAGRAQSCDARARAAVDGVVAAACATTRMLRSCVGHRRLPVSRFTVLNHSVGLLPRAAGARCAMYSALPCVPAIGEETTPQRAEPRVPRGPQHARDRIGAGAGIRHESALDRRAPDLELRLDQQHEVGVVGATARGGRQHVRERDERQVAGDERRRLRSTPLASARDSRRHVADVESLDRDDARVGGDGCRELAVTDIDGDHRVGAALAQHLA